MSVRNSLFSGVLLIVSALPAAAQITADELWKSWEQLGSDIGYTLQAGEVQRQGDQLVASKVIVTFGEGANRSVSTLDEVRLRETGGSVEVTTSETWLSETFIEAEDEKLTLQTQFTQSGYLMTVSGTAAAPSYVMKADSVSFTQNAPLSGDSKPEGAMNTSGTLTGIEGQLTVTGSEKRDLAYQFSALGLKSVMKASSPGDSSRTDIMIETENLHSGYKGTMPSKSTGSDEIFGLLQAGMTGSLESGTGALSYSIDVSSPEMPFKGEGGFAGTRLSAEITPEAGRMDLTLTGLRLGAEADPANASDLILNGTAVLNPAATSDADLMKSGKLIITVTNTDGLIAALGKAGLVPQDQLAMAPMMLMMFAKPGPVPGSMMTELETTESGDFLVNGQSMQ